MATVLTNAINITNRTVINILFTVSTIYIVMWAHHRSASGGAPELVQGTAASPANNQSGVWVNHSGTILSPFDSMLLMSTRRPCVHGPCNMQHQT